MPLQTLTLGPFIKGVVDGANSSLDNTMTLRSARHAFYDGKGRLRAGPGSSVAIRLMDDAGSPAPVTSVIKVQDFADGALAVGHSTVTSKVYLYRLDASFTGYYDLAGAFHAASDALPVGVLWTASATPPAVTIAELLNVAFITRADAATAAAQNFGMMKFDLATLALYTQDLDGTGAKNVYALGTFAFHGHHFLWGFDKGNVAATAFRPELLRHGAPDGGDLVSDGKGTFTVGHKIRSAREAIVGAVVAGEVAYVGTTYSVWPIVGYSRDSFDKSKPIDESFGFIGIQAAVDAGGVLYYWSPRGLARVAGIEGIEPLWDFVPSMIASIVDPEKIVLAYDPDRDQVLVYYRGATGGAGNQLLCSYDIRRDVYLGPDTDQGILVGCAGLVGPVKGATAAASPGPSGPPTTPSTTSIGQNSAIANWVNGDALASTVIEYRLQGGSTWTSAGTASPGVTTLTITGLTASTAYEWRAYHTRNAQSSSFLGPVGGTQFVTAAPASPLAPPTGVSVLDTGPKIPHANQAYVSWTNSGESGVSTRVTCIGPGFSSTTTFSPGVSSGYITIGLSGNYVGRCVHTKSGSTDSANADSASTHVTY